MSLPILHLHGTPYDQGRQHGAALRDRIEHNLAVYFDRFEHEGRVARPEVLARAQSYRETIADHSRDYFDGLRGVADGSGCDLLELIALNVRYEILYYQFGVNAMADGCTAFAIMPDRTANGHLIIGQNWDWIPQVQGAILHTVEADGLETIAFTEAGIVGGKIGLNSAGLGLAINGITSTDDDWSRLSKPFHVRCYEIMRSRNFDAAARIVTGTQRACSTNFLIAQAPDRIVNIEAAPDNVHVLDCEDGCVVHTNHFVDPAGAGIVEPPSTRRPYSYHRRSRMRALLTARGTHTISELQAYLCDHQEYPYSICRHEDPAGPAAEQYRTITAVLMDLHERRIWLSDGTPCVSEFEELRLDAEKPLVGDRSGNHGGRVGSIER
ncbi:MAG TPA: C45 family peptidase [Herpetosiphonaceae bacterium]